MGTTWAAMAQCPGTPPGNPDVYGADSWIGYLYSGLDTNNPPQNAFTTTVYRGYLTQPEQFDYDPGTGVVSGANICGTYSDGFSMRFRMQKNFTAGYYSFTLGGDDGVRLSVDGGATWFMSDWNYHSYQQNTAMIYLNGLTNLVIESYDQGGFFRVNFSYTACTNSSTAPTSISGTNAICNGNSTTLTATGGNVAPGAYYQWGTGTIGNNVIAGQTGASITVSPTANTTYWVRRVDPAPCSVVTTGITQQVTVSQLSTAPTAISGATSICLGNSVTLTASGGTHAAGSVYEWGTGTPGSNVIGGQTAASITVTPTATTTYWVRRTSANSCGQTASVSTTVNVTVPAGDQLSSGSNSWIGYVYTSIDSANPPTNAFTSTYRGYLTQPEIFDMNLGTGALFGTNICGTHPANFAIRFKMNKVLTAGYYTFMVGGDDGYRLSIDGGATWIVSNWQDHGYVTSTTAQLYLSGSTNFVIEFYERAGDTRVTFNYTACTDVSTAPTGISGVTSICRGNSTTLTATGGYAGSLATYQWGTGTIGTNVIAGQNTASIVVSPLNTTTYWVRRTDGSPCNLTTTGVSQQVTVAVPSTAPTGISGTLNTCGGSTTLTATGGTLATGGVYQWGTGTAGSNIISGQSSVSIAVTPSATTTYWVRRVDVAPCNTPTAAASATVTVNQASTAPTSISGSPSLCNTVGVTLSADGGTAASGATYQWGTGATVGNNVIGGQTNSTMYVNPTATTTYWVRRFDSVCNAYTAGVTVVVYRGSTGPYSISGANMVCANTATVLTAQGGTPGTGSVYQWGTGNTAGQNIISGQTAATISVTPTAQTTYWVRLVDQGSCPANTAIFHTINVYTAPTAPTSLTGTSPLCNGSGGTMLYVNGGSLGSNGQYQWGTGTVGTNIIGNNTNSMYINPTATTTYWVRHFDPTCNTYTAGVSLTVTVVNASTQPTGISGATSICLGSSTTLTATGGTHAAGATYAWGTGYTVGQDVIAGQTGASITVSPTVQTVYWVRRIDAAPCNTQTQGPSVTVNVTAPSTAPTSITGAPAAAACAGTPYTLTANGGTAASGSVYQWGTGATIGSNVITGQTGASITVNPSATTTYWVRRYDAAPCSAYTSGATTTVAVTTPPGTPSAFGANQWNVYGYSTADITLASAVYAGYYTQNTLSFSTQTGTNSWNNQASPSSSAGWNGCPVPNDNFTFVYKRAGFPCGTYTISLANWDDQAQVYVNGTLVWSCASWSGGGACSGNIPGSFNLSATSNIEIRVREQGGGSNLEVNFTKTDVASTAPTSISGPNVACDGAAITLTATGGTTGTNGSFQWGTGSVVGSNVIAGETSASISVIPTATTTYWVRRRDGLCGLTTAGVTQTVTVGTGTVAGTLASESTVLCRNSTPGNIVLSGNIGSVVKWQYASNAAFTAGVTDIASTATTLTSAMIGPVPSTRYFRAVVQSGQCNMAYTQPVQITIPAAVTYNGTWSGTPSALTPVIVSANLNLTSNLNVCACQVTNSASITIQPNVTLIVEREIIVEESSSITVENTGSVVQVADDAANIGPMTVKRNTSPMKNFDFTYWSSPVQNNTLFALSPNTRFDKYFSFNPILNQWVTHLNGAAVMEPGRGYILRAPANWSVTNATQGVYNGSFHGVANTGIVPVTIARGTSTFNLIGNPYPSAVDIDLFITDPANENLVNGTIYLWTHNTAVSASIPGNAQYNYTADDYAKYNLTGGVMTASNAVTGGERPTGKVASGQGFFIQTNSALPNGTYSATFRNSMRVVSENGQFFKNGNATTSTPAVALEKHRAWLTITNTDGAYDEMLLGYIEGATNEIDRLYDGSIFNGGNFVSLYSVLGTNKLAIQGRALPFDAADVIPLGYKSSVAGTFSITLDNFDGLFENQDMYLLDKSDMSYHLLNNAAYSFTTAAGIFDNRFELRFQGGQLGTGDVAGDNSVHIVKVEKHIEVSSGNFNMESVQIFDLTGKKILEKEDINSTLFSTRDLNIATQVLIVKVKLDNDQTITKKVIM